MEIFVSKKRTHPGKRGHMVTLGYMNYNVGAKQWPDKNWATHISCSVLSCTSGALFNRKWYHYAIYYVQNLELKDYLGVLFLLHLCSWKYIFKKCLLNTEICYQPWDQCHTVRSCVHLRHQSWSLEDDSDDKELDVDNRNCDTNMYCLIQKKPI
jgi:hypothetical protein